MNSRYMFKIIGVFIFSTALNWLSILLAPYASPDDLGQLAFIMVVFFPAAAFLIGIISRRYGLGLITAVLISSFAVSLVIMLRYNSSGLKLAPVYAAITISGYLIFWGLESIIRKIKKRT